MNRRDFVLKSSLATAAITSSTSVMANILSKKNTINEVNIGIIGTGDRGSGLIPFINDIKNLNVLACCDTLPFRLENGLSKVSEKAKGYTDYRKLLDNKNIDAVLISTPFNTHSKIAMDAIDAGKHVYCEKTMAKGLDGIQHLINKTKDSSKIFQTGHQYHSSRLYTHVVKLIKEGKVGKISSFECQWNRNGNWRRPVPKPEYEKAINWRMYREFSGGLVAELCSHQIDFVNWVLEETPNKAMGYGGIDYWKDGRETYDNIHLLYHYPSGVKASFTCLTSNAKDGYQIKVKGDKGTIIMGTRNAFFYPEGIKEKKLGMVDGVAGATVSFDKNKGYPIKIEHQNPSKQALQDFRDSILSNSIPISNLTTGANTAIAVEMGLKAMHNNTIIDWPSEIKF
ncbi:Gfo/Idh/MocA family oxidoreductase [uncultured Maribacter sp.]|uniref:Gfo/Idh/MocA family protein n=1 Tax=uncultured Maribacter sp. TaxID=431308 RepID=UPI002623FFDF|nr:Gfo/Idh/MocA family oxidoreductase [uncultured Maribacter sp.]